MGQAGRRRTPRRMPGIASGPAPATAARTIERALAVKNLREARPPQPTWLRSWPPRPRTVRGVLLDVDGTLADSNDAHARAWLAALQESGFEVPWRRIRRLIGTGADKLVPQVTGLRESDAKARRIVERRGQIFEEKELATVRPLPGARELLERMRREGLRWAVATSARPEEVASILERAGLADLVIAPPASAGDQPSKADPGVLQAALTHLKLEPHEVVMLGDTPHDLEAARQARVAAVLFRTGGWPDLQLAGAIAIYDSPGDLLARFEDSILHSETGDSPARGRRREAHQVETGG